MGAVLTALLMSCFAGLSGFLWCGVATGLAVCVPVQNPVSQGLLLTVVDMQSELVRTVGVPGLLMSGAFEVVQIWVLVEL